MAFLPGIFGGNKAQPQPQQFQQNPANNQQQHNQNQQQQNQQAQPSGGGTPGGVQGQMENNANSQVNPLDPFMKLMTPSKEVMTEQEQKNKQKNSGLFGDNFNAENIQKTVSNVNFAQNLDQAKVQAALGGDANAFMEVLNSAVQAGVSASVQMSHGMVEQGVKTGNERFSGDLDSRFRDFTLRGQTVDNPALQHPIGKSMLQSISSTIAQANPRMSAQEVHQNATKMLTEFSTLMQSPDKAAQQDQANKGQMDWMNFVEEPGTSQ